jgi:hypothetical protein
VPVVAVAPHIAHLNVTVVDEDKFCNAEIPDNGIDGCALPVALVVFPHVIVEPISINVDPSVLYCHCPEVGPEVERRTLYETIPSRFMVVPLLPFTEKVIKLFAVIAVEAFVGLVTFTVVPQAFPAGEPVVPNTLPRVKPTTVTLLLEEVADCGDEPAPL